MLSEQQPKVPSIDHDSTLRENFRRIPEDQGHIPSEAAHGFMLPDMLEKAPSSLPD